MGRGKQRWKIISIHRSSPAKPPPEFICPISGSLMADPVIISSGQTFERVCVQACVTLSFAPSLHNGSVLDFSTLIPNLALKSAILNWTSQNLSPSQFPKPLNLHAALKIVDQLVGEQHSEQSKKVINESPISVPSTPLQELSTRPRCCHSTSSSSSEMETGSPRLCEEEEYASKLRSSQVCELEEGVSLLRKTTRTSVDSRVSLCTPRILSALRPLIISKYRDIQADAVAAVVNLSLERVNKVKIVRAGVVPPLVEVLKLGFPEAQEHACGALFSLALDDDNKTAIGVLGALPPLIHMMRSQNESACHDSGLALYHLSLVQSNRSKLVQLGLVQILLEMVRSGRMTGRALLILCNLGRCGEGRATMMDGGAVECFVEMLRAGGFDSESSRENCVDALCALSHGGLRFKGLARAVGAVEVLRRAAREAGTERGRKKARRLVEVLEAKEEEEEEVDWEKVLGLGLPSPTFS